MSLIVRTCASSGSGEESIVEDVRQIAFGVARRDGYAEVILYFSEIGEEGTQDRIENNKQQNEKKLTYAVNGQYS